MSFGSPEFTVGGGKHAKKGSNCGTGWKHFAGPFVEVFMVRCLIYGKNTFRHRNRGAAQRSKRTCYTAEEPQQQTNKQRGN